MRAALIRNGFGGLSKLRKEPDPAASDGYFRRNEKKLDFFPESDQ